VYKKRIAEEAAHELERELAYSASRWGKAHAAEYARGLAACVHKIRSHPRMYAVFSNGDKDIRSVTYKGTRILYAIEEETQTIVCKGKVERSGERAEPHGVYIRVHEYGEAWRRRLFNLKPADNIVILGFPSVYKHAQTLH
jgi:plasmid stabilization system protein ParE